MKATGDTLLWPSAWSLDICQFHQHFLCFFVDLKITFLKLSSVKDMGRDTFHTNQLLFGPVNPGLQHRQWEVSDCGSGT